jgi:lambda family phage portal protein
MASERRERAAPRVTWWDRFLIGIAPGWGLRRLRSRAAAFAYEAASGGRRSSWHRSSSDANAAGGPSLSVLRELSRDLRRNNGWARRGIQTIANNTIGWGIGAKATGVEPSLAKTALELWNKWADSKSCNFDGQMPFNGIQRLVLKTVVESGEALVVKQPADEVDGLPVPLRVQVLEPDYLDTMKDRTGGDGDQAGPIIQGVEFDRDGRRVAYWLHRQHPGSMRLGSFDSRRVPARDVLHVYLVERAGQVRGVPWLTSAIARLNDFDEYDDAVLMQQKIAACFGAFVQDFEGSGTALGEQSREDPHLETLEPGHIEYLPQGKTVTFAQPPGVTDSSFTTRNLRRIAVSLGVTYEDLTSDYSMVNFSSARMARLAHWANVHEWRWDMVIPQLCDGVWRWAMELAAGLYEWPAVPSAEWAPPPMPMLEPDKEGLAYQRLVRTGAMTIYQMIRERGEDPASHLAEIAEANARLDDLGIVLDCDPRRLNASGGSQLVAAHADADDESEDDDQDDEAAKGNGKDEEDAVEEAA